MIRPNEGPGCCRVQPEHRQSTLHLRSGSRSQAAGATETDEQLPQGPSGTATCPHRPRFQSKQLQDENKIKHKESRTLIRQDDVVEVVILIINTGPGYMCKFT